MTFNANPNMTNDDFYSKLKRNKAVRTLLNSRWFWFALAVFGFAADQAIKFAVTTRMQLSESLPIFPCFNWVYVLNPGAAFSFLANSGQCSAACYVVARRKLKSRVISLRFNHRWCIGQCC